MSNPTEGAWLFVRDGDTLTVTEPDVATHAVLMGDWGSTSGVALLNRMVELLASPTRARAHFNAEEARP